MLPEFAASLSALAGLCQPAAGGAASLPEGIRGVIVALPSKAALVGVGSACYGKTSAAQSTPLRSDNRARAGP